MKISRISIFDIFKIGVGPSSSHTLGPWRAVRSFLQDSQKIKSLADVVSVECCLFGSLAFTGKGHQTDKAIILGFLDLDPETVEIDKIEHILNDVESHKKILFAGKYNINFDIAKNIIFDFKTPTDYHPNTFDLKLVYNNGEKHTARYYSTGGGFFELHGQASAATIKPMPPHPAQNAKELLALSVNQNKSIAELVFENESFWTSPEQVTQRIEKLWDTIKDCIHRGFLSTGTLPGGLNVKYRAGEIARRQYDYPRFNSFDEFLNLLRGEQLKYSEVSGWVSAFALAVNEINASMGRIVTSPTNGAAGVIPAVLLYAYCFENKISQQNICDFFCTAGEVGTLFVKEATISAAQGGCQAEIGVSSAMAAAGLTQIMGGTAAQVLEAAEIAMEHHLGLTCDPVGGLVQVPCIERNAMGACKAITASQLALTRDPRDSLVDLDDVIESMWNTAKDMNDKYKETSRGGLALSVTCREC